MHNSLQKRFDWPFDAVISTSFVQFALRQGFVSAVGEKLLDRDAQGPSADAFNKEIILIS